MIHAARRASGATSVVSHMASQPGGGAKVDAGMGARLKADGVKRQ